MVNGTGVAGAGVRESLQEKRQRLLNSRQGILWIYLTVRALCVYVSVCVCTRARVCMCALVCVVYVRVYMCVYIWVWMWIDTYESMILCLSMNVHLRICVFECVGVCARECVCQYVSHSVYKCTCGGGMYRVCSRVWRLAWVWEQVCGLVSFRNNLRQFIVSPTWDAYEPQQWPSWSDIHKNASGIHMLVLTDSCLTWLKVLLNGMEIMPDIRTLANFFGLMRSWILKKSPLLSLCLTSNIPNHILNLILKPQIKISSVTIDGHHLPLYMKGNHHKRWQKMTAQS